MCASQDIGIHEFERIHSVIRVQDYFGSSLSLVKKIICIKMDATISSRRIDRKLDFKKKKGTLLPF